LKDFEADKKFEYKLFDDCGDKFCCNAHYPIDDDFGRTGRFEI